MINSNVTNFEDQLPQEDIANRKLSDVPAEGTEVKFVDMFLSPSMIRNFIMLFAGHRLGKGPQDLYQSFKLRQIDMEQEKVQLAMLNSNLDHEVEEVNTLLLQAMDSLDFYQSKILGEIEQYRGIAEGFFGKAIRDAKLGKQNRIKKRLRRKRKLNTLKIQDLRDKNFNDMNDYNVNDQKQQLEDKLQKLDQELKLRNQILKMQEKIRQQIDQQNKLTKPKS